MDLSRAVKKAPTESDPTAIVWLRDDLRLDDHPALAAAGGAPTLIVYIHDEDSEGLRRLGGASRWWLARSLAALSRDVEAAGGRLDVLRGPAEPILTRLAKSSGAQRALWTRRYGAAEIAIDSSVKAALRRAGVDAQSFNGQLLREPWEVRTDGGTPFRVFSAFWRRSLALGPLPAPGGRTRAAHGGALARRCGHPDDDRRPRPDADPPGLVGRARRDLDARRNGRRARLAAFVEGALRGYDQARDRPAGETTSRLSPHLRFGEVSPRRVAAAIQLALAEGGAPPGASQKFLAELGWREFSYSLLHAFPDLARRSWQSDFDSFPFVDDAAGRAAWERGQTGYPIVDAGMRELWRTGFMHNRVRMVAASFLVKHLLIDWRCGERWFWDTLCDADPANNPASWQWVAGSGADAAPYFRIFNPILQGQKFDPDGAYVRRWVPELAGLGPESIHAPWTASAEALRRAGVTLGATYPAPIVDHDFARRRALAALARTKGGGDAGAARGETR